MAKNIAVDIQSALEKEVKGKGAEPKHKIHEMRIEARFGQKVRCYRKQRHLTQEQLGDLSGLNQNYISEIERGKRNVTLRVMEMIARALGVEMNELFK